MAAPPADAPTIRLEVYAASSCASGSQLAARVHARSPRIRFADDPNAPRVRVQFTEQAGGVAGSIVLMRPGAKPTTRRFTARSCSQAADAVALIIAVSFDPEAAAPAGENADERPVPGQTEPSKAPQPATESRVTRARGTEAAPRRFRFAGHVAAQSVFGPAPGVLPGISGYGSVELERDSVWTPAAVLGVTHAWRGGFEESGGDAAFVLDAALMDLCPLRLGGSRWTARACGSALFGRLSVEGSNTRNPSGVLARPFAVLGGAAHGAVALSSRFELTARVALGSTLVRDSFEFAPVVFHRASPVTVLASVGIGFR